MRLIYPSNSYDKRIISSPWLSFWKTVIVWVLVIICIQYIHIGRSFPPPLYSRINGLALSVDGRNRLTQLKTTQAPGTEAQPVITVWNGPIQPVNIKASSEVPVFLSIPTTEPVVFVGIDDGWVQDQDALDWLTQHHLPFTLFLTNNGIKNNYDYFRQLQNAGMIVEDHTLSHPDLTRMDFDHQKKEICQTADIYQRKFGHRPTLFRPPYGSYNDDTRLAAASCGIRALVMWHVNVGAGGDVQFQDKNNHLQPGDIILMHFRPEFLEDIKALAKDVQANHLQIGRLEDWLP